MAILPGLTRPGRSAERSNSKTDQTSAVDKSSSQTQSQFVKQLSEALSSQTGTTSKAEVGDSATTTAAKQTQEQETSSTAAKTTAGQRAGTQATKTETLSPEVQALLTSMLEGNAQGIDTGAIITEAKRTSDKAIERSATELAAATGSSQNSLVAQIELENQRDANTQLSSLAAQLQMQERESLAGSTAELAGVLKGAVSTGTSETTATTTAEELSNVLQSQSGETLTEEEQQVVTELSTVIDELTTMTQSTDTQTATEAQADLDELINTIASAASSGKGRSNASTFGGIASVGQLASGIGSLIPG